MAKWNFSTITNSGVALLSKLTSGTALSLLRAASGAGYVDQSELAAQIAVTDEKQELSFSTVSYPEDGKSVVRVNLTNTGVTTEYMATQIGVYAFDPDEGEILFLIAQADDQDGTDVCPESEKPLTVSWEFNIQYGQADGVTVVVNPANSATLADAQAMVDNHNAAASPHNGVLAKTADLSAHMNNKTNPHGVTAEQVGLGNVSNTSDSEKHVKYASDAGTAEKVKYSLVVRFKGGRTEGTDMWTFDGSTSRSINITPDKIGAAKEDHAHTADDLKTMLASGPMVLSSEQYGYALPDNAVEGQFFLLLID